MKAAGVEANVIGLAMGGSNIFASFYDKEV
jgi:hypothetical protein